MNTTVFNLRIPRDLDGRISEYIAWFAGEYKMDISKHEAILSLLRQALANPLGKYVERIERGEE